MCLIKGLVHSTHINQANTNNVKLSPTLARGLTPTTSTALPNWFWSFQKPTFKRHLATVFDCRSAHDDVTSITVLQLSGCDVHTTTSKHNLKQKKPCQKNPKISEQRDQCIGIFDEKWVALGGCERLCCNWHHCIVIWLVGPLLMQFGQTFVFSIVKGESKSILWLWSGQKGCSKTTICVWESPGVPAIYCFYTKRGCWRRWVGQLESATNAAVSRFKHTHQAYFQHRYSLNEILI